MMVLKGGQGVEERIERMLHETPEIRRAGIFGRRTFPSCVVNNIVCLSCGGLGALASRLD